MRTVIPTGKHRTLVATVRPALWPILGGHTGRGDLVRTLTIHSRPQDVEAGYADHDAAATDGTVCTGDRHKLIGRTSGLCRPRTGSVRLACWAALYPDGSFAGTWSLGTLAHIRAKKGKKHFRDLDYAVEPGEPFTVRMEAARDPDTGALGTLVEVVNPADPHIRRSVTVPQPWVWGFGLGPYVGGNCPASAPFVVDSETP
ncbi:MAG: hypothetical protein AAFU38_08660 [Bacteroidota bacterium]